MRRLGVALLGACLAAWLAALLELERPAPDADIPSAAALSSPVAPTVASAPPRTVEAPAHEPPLSAASEPAADAHPHPITAEHRRLQRELQLIAALNDALDARDPAALRERLASYRAHDPTDEQGLQAGYQCLLDCLEQPGAERAVAAARSYYERERASTLRRYIRRTCLEREL